LYLELTVGNQGVSILDWKTRLKIVAESAQGLMSFDIHIFLISSCSLLKP